MNTATTSSGRTTPTMVIALVAVPLVVALVEALFFHVQHRTNGSLVSSDQRRHYLLYVPTTFDASRPTPLVVSLHGGAVRPAMQRDVSGWNRLAEEHGFLVVYPEALDVTGIRGWRTWGVPGLDDDVRFLADLLDHLEEEYPIDPSRIYLDGFSNGGSMAFALSCLKRDRFAAIGTVAPAQIMPWSWCQDRRPMPVMSFHGTADTAVPYAGGTSWASPQRPFPDVEAWTAGWARRNRCQPDPIDIDIATGVTRRTYSECAEDAEVVLFTIRGGGHTWPGGLPLPVWFSGMTSDDVDATRELWAFFSAHRRTSTPHQSAR